MPRPSHRRRLHSPSLVVTSHDARLFPEAVGEGAAAAPLLFDRVLCDVPCSGDGTLRKNPVIWRRWTAGAGNMLHSLQVEIGCKGVRLLKVSRPAPHSTRDPRLFTATWASSQPWPRAGGRAARLLHLLPQPGRERGGRGALRNARALPSPHRPSHHSTLRPRCRRASSPRSAAAASASSTRGTRCPASPAGRA